MRPDERALQKLLSADAARLPVPDGMWQNISDRLKVENARQHRRRLCFESVSAQVRPVMAFAIAIGVFWLAVAPLGYLRDQAEPNDTLIARVVAPARSEAGTDPGPFLVPVQQPTARTQPGTSTTPSTHRSATLTH